MNAPGFRDVRGHWRLARGVTRLLPAPSGTDGWLQLQDMRKRLAAVRVPLDAIRPGR